MKKQSIKSLFLNMVLGLLLAGTTTGVGSTTLSKTSFIGRRVRYNHHRVGTTTSSSRMMLYKADRVRYNRHVTISSTRLVRAAYYSDKLEGKLMANGSRFHQDVPTAASLRYPLNSIVFVRNVKSSQCLLLRVTDRGPYSRKFGLDLSKAAYKMLGLDLKKGWGWVTIEEL